MTEFRKLAVLENMVEAELLEALLKEKDIPHVIRPHHDSALDGLFHGQQGWAHVEAPAEHEAAILRMLDDLRSHEDDQTE